MTHTPGKGCGCILCKQPLIRPPYHGDERNQELLAASAAATKLRRIELGLPDKTGRGSSST